MKSYMLGLGIISVVLVCAACGEAGSSEENNASANEVVEVDSEFTNEKVEIPANPKRIIADEYLASVIALGSMPIGAKELSLKNPYLTEYTDQIESIGMDGNESYEKILSLQPDLIITGTSDQAVYDELVKIAPTVAIPFGTLKNTEEEITGIAQLLGKEEQGEKWLENYQTRIEAARQKAQDAVGEDASFSILEATGKSIYVYGDNFGRGGQAVYQALDFQPDEEVADIIMEEQWKELSFEVLDEYAADYIVLTSNDKTIDDLKSDPIWSGLDAVKNDRVYVWQEERSWYYDPFAIVEQTEELADWLAETN